MKKRTNIFGQIIHCSFIRDNVFVGVNFKKQILSDLQNNLKEGVFINEVGKNVGSWKVSDRVINAFKYEKELCGTHKKQEMGGNEKEKNKSK